DAMASGAGPEEAAAFAEAYEARTGRPPGPAEAQALDAALLVLAARAAAAGGGRRGASLRAAAAAALAGARLADGACGPARVDAGGALRRQASLLQVDGGAFVPAP